MPTRQQVLAVLGDGRDYARAGDRLGVPAGQAYLIATGLPADGGDTFPPDELRRPGQVGGSTQQLVYRGLEVGNPTQKSEVHEWIRRRAAMDEPMVAAARPRHAAPGEREDAEVTDIAAVLTRQHDQVTALMEQLQAIPGVSKGGSDVHLSRRQSIVDMLTVALSQHETAEQEHFWPAVRSVWEDGPSVADQALEQEQQGKDCLARLDKTLPADPEFDELAELLEKALRKHVAFEDRVLLALRTELSEEEGADLGRRILDAIGHTPTRPHPHAPKRPGGVVKAAAAGAAALDRATDKAGHRPAERRGRVEEEPAGGPPVDAEEE